MNTKKWLAICVLPGLVLLAGCGKKEEPAAEQPAAPAATPAATAAPIDPATVATITIGVRFMELGVLNRSSGCRTSIC